jgi:RNA polymerase sigma-70 factor (ECF subfamily)
MKRVFLSQFKRRNRFVTAPIEDFDRPMQPSQEACLDLSRLSDAIERLESRHRQLVEAVAINGDSYEETALALSIPIGTVSSPAGASQGLSPA